MSSYVAAEPALSKDLIEARIADGSFTLFSRDNVKSVVWKSFKGILDERKREVFGICCCVNCHVCIRYKSMKNGTMKDYGTKNLRDHLLFCGTSRKRGRKDKDERNFKFSLPSEQDPSKSMSEEQHPPPIQPLPVVCKLENMAEEELLDVISSQVNQFKKLSNDNSFQSGDQNDESSTTRFLEDVANSSSAIDKRLTTISENTGTISPVDQYSNNIHNSSSISRSYEDEHDVFGRHVANELRSLPEDTARRWARFQIQKVLFEAHSFEENDL